MRTYLLVDKSTGEIIKEGIVQESVWTDPVWIDKQDTATTMAVANEIIKGSVVTDRYIPDVNPLALGTIVSKLRLEDIIVFSSREINGAIDEDLVITSIPKGTVVQVYGPKAVGQEMTVTDGILTYRSDKVGKHLFKFMHAHYVPWQDARVDII